MVAQTPVDLASLSVEELKALKRQWWQLAINDGCIAAIGRVVRELGIRYPKKHGATVIWEYMGGWAGVHGDGFTISLDDYVNTLMVRVSYDRFVCTTGYGAELFVPGDWMDAVWAADVEARARIDARKADSADSERQHLLRQLGGAS